MKVNIGNFYSVFSAYNFLIDNEIVCAQKECSCGREMNLVFQKRNGRDTVLYRCQKKSCGRRSNLLSSKVPLHTYLCGIYYIMSGATYWQINMWLGLSDPTIISIKKSYGLFIKNIWL